MTPADLAKDVIELMAETESGKSWVRLRTDKPRYVIRAQATNRLRKFICHTQNSGSFCR